MKRRMVSLFWRKHTYLLPCSLQEEVCTSLTHVQAGALCDNSSSDNSNSQSFSDHSKYKLDIKRLVCSPEAETVDFDIILANFLHPTFNQSKAFTRTSVNHKMHVLCERSRLFQPQKSKIETLDRLEIEVSRRKLYQPGGSFLNSGGCKREL